MGAAVELPWPEVADVEVPGVGLVPADADVPCELPDEEVSPVPPVVASPVVSVAVSDPSAVSLVPIVPRVGAVSPSLLVSGMV